LDDDQPV